MPSRTRRAVAFSLAFALLTSAIALRADEPSEIVRGIELYNNFEYNQAVDVLSRALSRSDLSTVSRIEGYRALALCHVVLDHPEEAKAAFGLLLEVKPDYLLPETENPKALTLFAEARTKHVDRNKAPPPTPSPSPGTDFVVAAAPPKKKPIYKKWWFWTVIGVGAVGLGLGLGLGLGIKKQPDCPGATPQSGCAEVPVTIGATP